MVFTQISSRFSPKINQISSQKPDAQLTKGGPCLNFAHFFMQFCNPGDPKGGPWPNGPPLKYAPEDSPSEDRPSRGQGPRTQAASVLQKKVLKNFFQAIFKKRSSKFFSGDQQNFNNSKNSAVLKPRTGQFSRLKPRT